MKIVKSYPPNFKYLEPYFQLNSNCIFAYGDTIYNPHNLIIPMDAIIHEEVHERQQREIGGPEIWWLKYCTDISFRLLQEIEAYHAQYKYFCSIIKDRNKKDSFLSEIAQILSGPVYGKIIRYQTARNRIKYGSVGQRG